MRVLHAPECPPPLRSDILLMSVADTSTFLRAQMGWGTRRERKRGRIRIGCVCTCRGACGRAGGTGIFTSYGRRYESACHARTQHARPYARQE